MIVTTVIETGSETELYINTGIEDITQQSTLLTTTHVGRSREIESRICKRAVSRERDVIRGKDSI